MALSLLWSKTISILLFIRQHREWELALNINQAITKSLFSTALSILNHPYNKKDFNIHPLLHITLHRFTPKTEVFTIFILLLTLLVYSPSSPGYAM